MFPVSLRRSRFSLPLFGVLLLAAAVLTAARPGGRTELLTAPDASVVRFRVDFDPPSWRTGEVAGTGYRYPVWAGLIGGGEAGAPSIPVRVIGVAVPFGGAVSVSAVPEMAGRSGGVRFPPVPGYAPPPPGFRPLTDDPDPDWVMVEGDGYAAAAPGPWAEAASTGVERGLRVVNVAVHPVTWNPATGEAVWARSVTVSVATDGARRPAGAPARPVADAVGEGAWNRDLVNPGSTAALRASAGDEVPQPPAGGVPPVWFDDADGWAKIEIAENGVYRLDRQALQQAGVPVDTVDPRTLRIFTGPLVPDLAWTTLDWPFQYIRAGSPGLVGYRQVYETPAFTEGLASPSFHEVATWARGNLDDGTLDAGDDLIFYALGPDNFRDRFGLEADSAADFLRNPYTDHTVYWLAWGGDLPGEPLRMEAAGAAPQAGAPVVVSGRTRVHARQSVDPGTGNPVQPFHDPSLFEIGYPWEMWFWDFIRSDSGGKRFRVNLPGLVAGTALDARVRLWGAQVPTGSGEGAKHHVRVTVNDVDLGVSSWGGASFSDFTHQDVVVSDVAARNPSSFVATVLELTAERYDKVNLAWIDVTYTRSLDAGGAAGEFDLDPGEAGRTVEISHLASGDPVVLDVTDAWSPRRLTGVQVSGSGSAARASFALSATGSRVVATVPAGDVPRPPRIRVDTPPQAGGARQWLRETSGPLDYVIIAGDALAEDAETLAAWRRTHLPPVTPGREARVRVVRVSDIMDEFAWGMYDPVALRYFLEYAYRYYGNPAVDDRLSYCLFLGDHTYDFRDQEQLGVTDVVPSWEWNHSDYGLIGEGNVQYAGDDPLARFDGALDRTTDLYLGRIPCETASEARDILVNKVIRSERTPSYGPWRAKAILIADDICQGGSADNLGFVHMSQTERLNELLPSAFDRDPVYLYDYGESCDILSKPEAKRALLKSWTEGAWLVNYVGHGGVDVMADEQVFRATDVPLLGNDNRLPVLGAFSCSVGKFNKPKEEGVGEALVRASRTGTIVSAAATHLTNSISNSSLNLEFVRQLFPDPDHPAPVPIGAALMEAKRRQGSENDKYVCLGDPASLLNVPSERLEIPAVDSLVAGTTPEFTVRATDAPGGGTADVLVQGTREYRTENSKGLPFSGLAGYHEPGALLYRGRLALDGDSARVVFTVPSALRPGTDGRARVYAWGADWDGLGTLVPLDMVPRSGSVSDTVGPTITLSGAGASVSPGDEITVNLEDPSGINLTQTYEFLAVQLKVFDQDGLENLRVNLTDRFNYDSGSHTRGTLTFDVPELASGLYRFVVTAADNFNNTGRASVDLAVGAAGGRARFHDVAAYPNPFNPEREPTRVLFSLERPARVTARIYTVSGRLVWRGEMAADGGRNALSWEGRDEVGDPVANGVYLVQLTAKQEDGGGTAKHLERVVVLR